MADDKLEIMLTAEQIEERVKELAAEISRDYKGKKQIGRAHV